MRDCREAKLRRILHIRLNQLSCHSALTPSPWSPAIAEFVFRESDYSVFPPIPLSFASTLIHSFHEHITSISNAASIVDSIGESSMPLSNDSSSIHDSIPSIAPTLRLWRLGLCILFLHDGHFLLLFLLHCSVQTIISIPVTPVKEESEKGCLSQSQLSMKPVWKKQSNHTPR